MQNHQREMQFCLAKAKAEALWAENKRHSDALNAFLSQFPRGPMGLTPEHVKAMPEYQQLSRAYAESHARLGEYNKWFTKAFAKERREQKERCYSLAAA